jgi:anti-sigma regulatory factor (Ser/Thr protein kinase)
VGEASFVDELLGALPDVPDVQAVRAPGASRRPGPDLRRFQELLDELGPATRARVVHQMPAMADGQWQEWRRYEAATNVVLGPYPAWGTCAYDRRHLDAGRLADLTRTHPHVRTALGHRPSVDFSVRDEDLRLFLHVPPDPVELTRPWLSLTDPTPAAARRAVGELAAGHGLPGLAVDSAVLAASEVVSNAWRHGRAPVTLRAWADGGRVTVAVRDAGDGPPPLVGMLPVPLRSPSGRGMWILHQLLTDICHRVDGDGYTVRFSADRSTGTGA